MDTEVTTVIVNATKQELTVRGGNRQCYARLSSVKVGGEYRMHLEVNWTYQEFVVQDKAAAQHQLLISSDDCCDYERITIHEHRDGGFDVPRELRPQFRSCIGSRATPENYTPNKRRMSSWKMWLSKFLSNFGSPICNFPG